MKEHGAHIGTTRREELELFLQRLICSFQSGNYEGCAATLAKAERHRSKGGKDGDLDLAHNLATEASLLAVRVGENQKDYDRYILYAVGKARATET